MMQLLLLQLLTMMFILIGQKVLPFILLVALTAVQALRQIRQTHPNML